MKNRLINFIPVLLLLFSCGTAGTVLLDTINEEDLKALYSTEYSLVMYRLTSGQSYLEEAENGLDNLDKKKTGNAEFTARRACLRAEWLLCTEGDKAAKEIEELLKTAVKANASEERIILVRALQIKDKTARYEYLLKEQDRPNAARILLELGDLAYQQGYFKKAVSFYDAALLKFPSGYEEAYASRRDAAFRYIGAPVRNGNSIVLLEKKNLRMSDLVTLINNETDLMNALTVDMNDNELFRKLYENGFFADPNLGPGSSALRKDAAFFIAALIARKENNPDLLRETADYYLKNGWTSPIPDVPVSAYYFSAAVFVVEMEIMALPDGKKFYPDRTLSGEDALDILKQLKNIYRITGDRQ